VIIVQRRAELQTRLACHGSPARRGRGRATALERRRLATPRGAWATVPPRATARS